MSENNDVQILDKSEFSGFTLSPMDLVAFCKTVLTKDENKDGIPVVVEGVTAIKEKTFKGKKKPGFTYKLTPQEPIKHGFVRKIVDGRRKNSKTGEMEDAKVYADDVEGNPVFIELKKKSYDKPIHISLSFKEKRMAKCKSSDEYPDGEKPLYVVSPLSTAFPVLNLFLQTGGYIKEGNENGFTISQEILNEFEGFEFVAGCEVIKLEGLLPYRRITASEMDFDFESVDKGNDGSESEVVEGSDSDESADSDEDEW